MTRKQQRDFQEGGERKHQVTIEQQTFKEQSVLNGLAKASSNDFLR